MPMLRHYFKLVLKSGQVFMQGDPWPDENGAPMKRKDNGQLINGEVWMIAYQGEQAETETDEKSGVQTTTIVRPERYFVLMRAKSNPGDDTPHGIKNPAMCPECKGKSCASCPEETQVYEIPAADVKFAGRVQGFNDAVDMIQDCIEEMNEELLDDEGPDESETDEPVPEAKPNGTASEVSETT